MSKSIQLQSGQKFGKLVVISLHHKKLYYKQGYKCYKEYYLCKCDCGKETIVEKSRLKLGEKGTKSCGCLQKEMVLKANTKHGMYKTRIYKTWDDMIQRCHNKNEPNYRYCGAKGIIVCDEWKKNFVSFYNWAMSNGYKDNLTIDRINNYGNYEPANCRWITIQGQERNKKTNRILEYKGEKHLVVEWAELLNIKPNTIWSRLYRGWSIERALENK